MELRTYQEKAINDLASSLGKGNKRVILQAATGSGKTVMASNIVKRAVDKGNKVLFLAHRRELISQCSDKLQKFGIEHGIIMAGETNCSWHKVQVASVDTLRSRVFQNKKMELPEADIIIIDECHRTLSATYRKIIAEYEGKMVLGLTATPCRSDGRGLGHVYQDMVSASNICHLTEDGYLVPVRYYAPTTPDLKGIKLVAGDYNQKQLAVKMDQPKLVGDVVTNWLKIAQGKPTVAFASSVAHSIHIMEQFQSVGIAAAHIDGKTSNDERDIILKKLSSGEITVLCNCLVLTEGWDCPTAQVCILARPTKSLGLYLQMVGRVLRPMENKEYAMLIDHSGAVYEHGFVDDEFEWDLNPKKKIQEAKRNSEKKERKPITCEKCFTVYSDARMCPNCGSIFIKKGRALIVGDGDLGEVDRKSRKAKNRVYTQEEKDEWYAMLKYHGDEKGYKDGWAYFKYKDKFGETPVGRVVHKKKPNKECRAWITYINIRNSKRRSA